MSNYHLRSTRTYRKYNNDDDNDAGIVIIIPIIGLVVVTRVVDTRDASPYDISYCYHFIDSSRAIYMH